MTKKGKTELVAACIAVPKDNPWRAFTNPGGWGYKAKPAKYIWRPSDAATPEDFDTFGIAIAMREDHGKRKYQGCICRADWRDGAFAALPLRDTIDEAWRDIADLMVVSGRPMGITRSTRDRYNTNNWKDKEDMLEAAAAHNMIPRREHIS